jgi:hypothetical protein
LGKRTWLTQRHALQGLLTNDTRRLQRGADGAAARAAAGSGHAPLSLPCVASPGALPAPLYAALLNSAGRVLHDAFLHPQPGGALLADVPAESAAQARGSARTTALLLSVRAEPPPAAAADCGAPGALPPARQGGHRGRQRAVGGVGARATSERRCRR